ncbi:DNA methyltransferase [Streptomyces sp. RO-S4]|uniref:type ISP restriction/modification enzyme n=1 Tax=unclassified Streptomyces TaxID=2593676 RepID=UPI00208F608D|nr:MULTISPECIES: type ISP restriction/modification enzyme [unclassified Streptomyces]MCO4697328.1 DNA methyltransferase [Streptomyces sp. RO-S4]MDU0304530.1 type ISP restriction/modification enzyme [Streptomyces sp. PAL114]
MPSVTHDDAPLLADLMPWSVAPPRLGRGWPAAPDAASLKARWDALVKAEGPDREALFQPTRSRTPHTAVGQLPGQDGGTERLARATGPCPEPVRVLHGPFDEQWLIPDQRLIDAPRPELWRVADARQVFAVETAAPRTSDPGTPGGPPLLVTSLLPSLRTGRIRPLYRRPGAAEPNLAPGLTEHLAGRLGLGVSPVDVLAWATAVARPAPNGLAVPLTADPDTWRRGVSLGRRLLWLMRRDGERPKLPGGRRPYVRAPLPARPSALAYDGDEEALLLGEGRISPVPREAWDFEAGGVRVLEEWFAARTLPAEPGTLAAIRPADWPQGWTSELLELVTVLTLLAELRPLREELTGGPVPSPVTPADLRTAGVLPVPPAARRPASVLDAREEGPEGQLALI